MKKTILTLLACALLLAAGRLPARALEDADDLFAGRPVSSLAAMEGGFFALTDAEEGQTVWVIHPGQAPAAFLSLAPEDAVTHLLAQGDALCGFRVDTGRLGRISVQGIAWQEQALDTELFTRHPYMARRPFLMDNKLYTPLMDITSAEDFAPCVLAVSDLKTGETALLKGVEALAFLPYKPGQMLLVKVEEKQDGCTFWKLAALRMDSLKETPLPLLMPEAFPYSSGIGGLAYDAQADRIIYSDARQVMASTALAPFERVALLGFDYMDLDSQGLAVDGGYAVYRFSLCLRRVDRAIDVKDLTVRGNVPPEAVTRFRQVRPDVLPLVQNDQVKPEDVFLRVRGGDDTVDIFILSVNPDFRALIDKGYALDLSGDAALMADAAGLYPALRASMTNVGGQLCAAPVNLFNSSTCIDKDHWRAVFSDRPFPRTWGELMDARMAFAGIDQDELIFFSMGDSPEVVKHVLEHYILRYERQDSPLDFDRPALRHALGTYLAAKNLRLDVEEEDPLAETGPVNNLIALFSSGWQFGARDGNDSVSELPPFVFEAGEEPLDKVHVFAAIINPNSKDPGLAVEFLKTLSAKEADPRRFYAIHPNENEPYPYPEEQYAERIALMKDELGYVESEIKQAEEGDEAVVDLDYLKSRAMQLKNDLADQERLKWMLSAEDIAGYREKARYMALTDHALLLGEQAWQQIEGLSERLYHGALTVDAFILEMNRLAALVYKEAQ
ncbi:MAG: hypothetical protein ACOX62_03550 [Christensenellales bacterium]